jgi:hypothetical protein
MKGAKMGVSTVTISIEEFEDLIESKKKLDAIKRVVDENENKTYYLQQLQCLFLLKVKNGKKQRK